MSDFIPTFFPKRFSEDEKPYLNECILAFCISSESDEFYLSYDKDFITQIIDEMKIDQRMDYLALLFGFVDYVDKQFIDNNPVLYIRKLYSFSYFAGPLITYDSVKYYNELANIFEVLIETLPFRPELTDIVLGAINYALFAITPRLRDSKMRQSDVALIVKTGLIMRDKAASSMKTKLVEFLYNAIFCFNGEKDTDDIYQEVVRSLAAVIRNNFEIEFNYMAFVAHLVLLLETNFTTESKIATFLLISTFSEKHPEIVDFVLDAQNLDIISRFAAKVIDQCIPSPAGYTPIRPYVGNINNKVKDIGLQKSYKFDPQPPKPNIRPYERPPKFANRSLAALFQAIIKLCGSSTNKSTKSLELVARLLISDKSLGVAQFSARVLYYIPISPDIMNVVHPILASIFEVGFLIYNDPDVIDFSLRYFPNILASNKLSVELYMSALEIFIISAQEYALTPAINELVQIAMISDLACFHFAFEAVEVTKAIAVILLNFVSCLWGDNSEEIRNKIIENLTLFLELLNHFFYKQKIAQVMIQSADFIGCVIKISYARRLVEFSGAVLIGSLRKLKKTDQTLLQIFQYFVSIFKDGEPQHVRYILRLFLNAYPENSIELSSVLTQTTFIQEMINFASRSPEDIDIVFRVYTACSNDSTSPIFNSLSKVISEEDAIKIAEDLFENNFKNAIASLSVLYDIFGPAQKHIFIERILLCCQSSEKTTNEINSSNLPAKAIATIQEYRMKNEIDGLFELLCYFISFIGQRSLKSSDMLSLIQSLSPLPGNFRPKFTIRILNTLQTIFDSNYTIPTSLFKLNGNPMLIPDVPLKQSITELTYMCEVKFRSTKGNLIRLFSTNGSAISFDLDENHIAITQRDTAGNAVRGAFKTEFAKSQWYKLTLTYKNNAFSLYIRGEKREVLMAKEIIIDGAITKSSFGAGLSADLGSFSLYCYAFSEEEVALMNKFPLVPCAFSPAEAEDYESLFAPLFTGRLYDNMIYSYNASLILNNVYAVNMSPMTTGTKMLKLDCPTFSFPSKPKNAIANIGGSVLILPLFAQLDMPVLPPEGKPVNFEFEPKFLPSLLSLLISILSKSPKNQQNFYEFDGFRVISYLISKSKLDHITEEVITKLKELYLSIMVIGLGAQMLQSIFFDPKLWIYLPLEKQLFLYKTIDEIFEGMSAKRRQWFSQQVSFSKILCLMKVCYWSKVTDPNINMLTEPKMDPITKEEEAKRPTEIMPQIRECLWRLADKVSRIRFSVGDATTLCYMAFDTKDADQTYPTITYLLGMMADRLDSVLPALRTNLKFSYFFNLFTTRNQKIRAQAFHLMMRGNAFQKENRKQFFQPLTFDEWINAIMFTMSLDNNDMFMADIIYAYMFGLVDPKSTSILPTVRISEKTDAAHYIIYDIANEQLIPFCLMIVSDFETSVAVRYIEPILSAIHKNPKIILNITEWEVPFIMFIISRIKEEGKEFDEAAKMVMDALLTVCASGNTDAFKEMTNFFAYFSQKAAVDYSFVYRAILFRYVTTFITTQTPKVVFEEMLAAIWSFLFAIPSTSKYFNPFSTEEHAFIKYSFQELQQLHLNVMPVQVSFTYATRTNSEGVWEDAMLANNLIGKMRLFSLNHEQKAMMAFVLGRGLSHEQHFMDFARFIRDVTAKITGTSDHDLQILVNYMSGLIKSYLSTNSGHQSHLYLQEDSQAFAKIIHQQFKESTKWGSSVYSFDAGFNSSGHNFAHEILTEFAKVEKSIDNSVSKMEHEVNDFFEKCSKSNQKYANIGSKFSVDDKNFKLDPRSEQVKAKMAFIANEVDSESTRGQNIYTRLWHSLGYGTGIWKSPESNTSPKWQLSNYITRNGRRGRLTMNYNFDDHKNASLLRDLGNPIDAAEQYKKHMQEMRVTSFSDNSGISMVPEEKLFEKEENEMDYLLKVEAKLIRMRKVYSGNLIVYPTFTVFESTGKDNNKMFRIGNVEIRYIFLRQYLLVDSAIEIFSTKVSLYLDFGLGLRDKVLTVLQPVCNKAKFVQRRKEDIKILVDKATEKWQRNKISNFEYLMKLNIYAGRSYNDLSKYPVYPWILQDYKSETLDLSKPEVYRDLSKPIGAINKERLMALKERYTDADADEDMFLYGSFYSSAAVVIGYLIRIEPFTSLHIELQSGKFDISDRLFSGIPNAWDCCNKVAMDFRELIPEFFYFPDFLLNSNEFDLGKSCDDVVLPPWAKDAPDFITKNAAALESPYVSANLPKWIDLIFGVTSRGQLARQVDNIYSKNFYDSSVTQEVMNTPHMLSFAREYAACFGSAGYQLFTEPHRSKITTLVSFPFPKFTESYRLSEYPIIAVGSHGTSVVGIDLAMTAIIFDTESKSFNKYSLPSYVPPEFVDISLQSQLIRILKDAIVYTYTWSPHINIADLNTGRIVSTKKYHNMPVTCLAADKHLIVSSSSDCTVQIKHKHRIFTLTKHRTSVKCVAFSVVADAMISASIDGNIILFNMSSEKDVHSYKISGVPIYCGVSDMGLSAIIYYNEIYKVIFFDANLLWPKTVELNGIVDSFVVFASPDGFSYAAIAIRGGGIHIYNVQSAQKVAQLEGAATSLFYDKKHARLIRGSPKGEISLVNIVNALI